MRMIKSVALALLQCISIFVLSAQQPNIEITLDNSIHIQYPYDDVIMLPNGDLQFYDINADVGSIQVTGFQYKVQTNTLTDVIQIGNITGIQGECHFELRTQRFGKFYSVYSVYQYPDSYNPQGLVVLKLDANDLAYRIIDDMGYSAGSALFRTEIVAEDTFIFALEDSLVYYDFTSDTSQTLLEGDAYQCTLEQDKRVYAMPDGHFMYIKDSMMGYDTVPETWIIYDSQGNYQFTKTLTDQLFGVSTIGVSFYNDFNFVNERFYIPNPGITNDEAYLECHFPSPDSLHYYVVPAPGSLNEGDARFVRFGDDRILRSYYDYLAEQTYLYMNHSPLEYNPEPTHWMCIGPFIPQLNIINDYIVTYSIRLENYIFISALCTLDFPAPHSFIFPAPPVDVYLPSIAFSCADKLLFINDSMIYVFHIDFSVSNSDETEVPPVHTLSAYPNPFNPETTISFELSKPGNVVLNIYNLKGELVKKLINNQMSNGKHSIVWEGKDNNGHICSSGVYFYKIESNGRVETKKMLLLK